LLTFQFKADILIQELRGLAAGHLGDGVEFQLYTNNILLQEQSEWERVMRSAQAHRDGCKGQQFIPVMQVVICRVEKDKMPSG